ncbi:MAG: DUF4428 domain-containing protein, partial [Firmicutes bacterium]|nr:DUF4428 domain-containing protein [Bacillota bacterium]
MGLFDKKYCDVCGEKIGLLGNRKLEDGNLCKDCAAKLSPWFSERKQSTIAEIKEQLAYREANKDAVAAFHTTRTIGTYTKLMLDEDNRKFVVTSASNLASANPDVLDFSQVTGCNLEVDERENELTTKDSEGKSVSYEPPRYSYEYDFYMNIDVNHPYFNQIRFKLNSSTVEVDPIIETTTQVGSAGMNRTAGTQPAMSRPQPSMQGRPAASQPGAMNRTAGTQPAMNRPQPSMQGRPAGVQP